MMGVRDTVELLVARYAHWMSPENLAGYHWDYQQKGAFKFPIVHFLHQLGTELLHNVKFANLEETLELVRFVDAARDRVEAITKAALDQHRAAEQREREKRRQQLDAELTALIDAPAASSPRFRPPPIT